MVSARNFILASTMLYSLII
ncbi:hypothetical protein KSF78_0003622 [Schistosoma japonicum]|nr:hypothetical protein KSF78_0003622 [Schistosoma japonicum]